MAFIEDVPTRNQYSAAAGQTIFDYDFPIFDEEDIQVQVNGVLQTLGSAYTVQGVEAQNGGTITFLAGLVEDDIVTLERDVEKKRITDFSTRGSFSAKTMNLELDRMLQMTQDEARKLTGAVRAPSSDQSYPLELLPSESDRADKVLAFADPSGQPVAGVSNSLLQTLITTGLTQLVPDPIAVVADFAAARAIDGNLLIGGEAILCTDINRGGFLIVDLLVGQVDNDGTILNLTTPNGFYLRRQYAGSLHTKWFGDTGDNITNDTTAIQNCLDVAATIVQNIGIGVDLVTQGVVLDAGIHLVTGVSVGEGVFFDGTGQNSSILRTVGAVTTITMGGPSRFYSGIWITNIGFLGDFTAGSIGIQYQRTIRNCGISHNAFFGLDIDIDCVLTWAMQILSNHCRGALSYNLRMSNGSHSIVANNRFDVAGINNVYIDGQPAETLNLNFKDNNFQSAQESAIYGIDCGSVYITDCDFESNNKLNLLTHADVKFVSGTAARIQNIFNIKGGFWSTGSSPGGNHVCIDIEEADTVNVSGMHGRGNTFAKGVVVGANVNRLNISGGFFQSISIPFEAGSTTRVNSDHRGGRFITNNVPFDRSSTYSRQDALVLRNEAQSAGIGNIGGSISATSNYADNRRAYIAAIQTGADADQWGWEFGLHGSASSIDMNGGWTMEHTGHLLPYNDNTQNFGSASLRAKEIFAGNGTINTSDAREKTKPLAIDDTLMDAWEDVFPCIYQWLSAVDEKGSAARKHTGYIVQEIMTAFESHALDPMAYGLVCYDEFEVTVDEPEEVEEIDKKTGKKIKFTRLKRIYTGEMANRYGLRYTHIIAIIDACRRRDRDRMMARLEALESK